MKKYSDPNDPKGLIYEAYQIPNITEKDCRTIFFDWALSIESGKDPVEEIRNLYEKYVALDKTHPMTLIFEEGFKVLGRRPKRRRRAK